MTLVALFSEGATKVTPTLRQLLICRPQVDLGIAGTPPEKSMYLSVLRQTGIHRQTGDGWHFSAPARTADEGIGKVWHAITEFFAQSETNFSVATMNYWPISREASGRHSESKELATRCVNGWLNVPRRSGTGLPTRR